MIEDPTLLEIAPPLKDLQAWGFVICAIRAILSRAIANDPPVTPTGGGVYV